MTIDIKVGTTWAKVEQPFFKINDRSWVPLKRVLNKVNGEWKEIWPSEIVRETVAGGSGFCINIWDEMGRPTAPGNYTYINNGTLGGGVNCPAIRTGRFPPGSVVKLINNGMISGRGGNGAVLGGALSYSAHAEQGGDGVWLEVPTIVQNNGVIQGGGGGGGMDTEQSGTHYYCNGGGGAGYPAGSKGGNGVYGACYDGSLNTGGSSQWGTGYAAGGNPGVNGTRGNQNVGNSSKRATSFGARGGAALQGSSNLLEGSYGLDSAARVKGPIIPGTGPMRVIVSRSVSGRRTVFYSAPEGASIIGVSRSGGDLRQTNYSVSASQMTISGGTRPDYARESAYLLWTPTLYWTVRRADGSTYQDSFTFYIGDYNSGRASTCFAAGVMVTMADGSMKPIELVEVGDLVKTPFGSSRVRELDRPFLGERKLYQMDIDGKCLSTAEHDIWGRNPITKEEWWTTRDMEEWIHELEQGLGSVYSPHPVNLGEKPKGAEWEFASVDGWRKTSWSEVEAPEGPDTLLYHFWLDDGGCYYADGYLVKSMPKEEEPDWHSYRHMGGAI